MFLEKFLIELFYAIESVAFLKYNEYFILPNQSFMKKLMTLCSAFLLILTVSKINAQTILKGGTGENEVKQTLEIGATELDPDLFFIQSVALDPGYILVLFERYSDGKISGRHRLVRSNESDFSIGFKCKYAIVFENKNDEVMGFEDAYFGGNSMTFQEGINDVPDDFGMTSIYIPQDKNVKLYMVDPDLYPNQEIDHRPMSSGIRPFIGVDVNDQVKFILVE